MTAAATAWPARLNLSFAERAGRTVLTGQRHSGPLLAQKPFYPEPYGCCHVYLIHPPGGIVGSDALGRGAHALLTTPGATRFYRSNGPLARQDQALHLADGAALEWLQSPVIYLKHGAFAAEARALVKAIYAMERGIYHYRNMARANYRGYLKDQIVPLKKYFYALRPLLAIKWIERYRKPAPVEFGKLKQLIPAGSNLDIEISKLLARRRNSREQELTPAVPELNTFIETELARLKNMPAPKTTARSHRESLNSLFRKNLA